MEANMKEKSHCAMIAEDFAGMRAQALGLAERLGASWEFHAVKVKKNALARFLPVSLWWDPLSFCEEIILSKEVRFIVSVGGKGGAMGRCLAQKYGLPLIQIQDPRHKRAAFPLIIAPEHDGLKGKNVISLPHAVHAVTEEILEEARFKWMKILKGDKKYLLSILLGGGNGRYRFSLQEAQNIAKKIRIFLEKNPQSACFITPSRRTSPENIVFLKQALEPLGAVFWDGRGENPYLGMLACADMIAVTQESVSMISEAIATEAKIAILPLKGRSKRLEKFKLILEEKKRIIDFDENLSFQKERKCDEIERALRRIRAYLKAQEDDIFNLHRNMHDAEIK